MRDRDKTKDQLVSELVALRQRVSELEASETRRRRGEDALGKGNEWHRQIIDTAYEGVWVIDTEGKTEYVNRRMAEMLGYTVEEMLDRSVFDFLFESDLAASKRKIEQRKRGVGEQAAFRFRCRDGSELWVLSSTNPLQEGGKTVGMLGMMTDITERKRAAERIHFQAQLLDAVGQAVIAIDVEGNVTYWNRCAKTLYGWSAEEVMGRRLGEILVPNDQRERAAEIMADLRAGKSWSGEFVVQRRDGTLFPVMITNTPVQDEQGNMVGIIGVSVDITERKQVERLRAVQYGVSRLLAESSSHANSSRRILGTIGRGLEWDYAGLWAIDPTEKMLRCIGTWRDPSISAEFEQISRSMRFAKGEGLLGCVWAREGLVWTGNVTRKPDFLRFDAALSAGLRSGLGYPICVKKKVVGVLELFSSQARKPDKDSTAAIRALSDLIGQFMERKRAEEELQRQMEILREQARLLDLAHDAIMCRDMSGTLTFWNQGAEEVYGWSREEALGESSYSLLKTQFPKPLDEIEAELLREGRWEGELIHTRRDGTQAVTTSRWALRQDDHGQPSAILEINTDITEHKQLELREYEARHQLQTALKALQESEARFKRLAEVNIIGVVAADFNGHIIEANEAFLRTVGYTQEDLLWGDLHLGEITPPEYRHLDEQAMEQLERSGVCMPYEKEYLCKGGSRVSVLVGAVVTEESHHSSIAFVLDLTERRRNRETSPKVRRVERRQVAREEAREDLVAALRAMRDGTTGEDLESDSDASQRLLSKELDDLRQAIERLRVVVSDLHVKYLDRGQSFIRAAQSLAHDRTFLEEVEFLVELNRQIAPGREIQLAVEDGFPPELPALTRLELLSILREALVNARRHSEARCVRVTMGGDGDSYWAEISDDGQGFETGVRQGGMGISGMREAARALGGELELESEPGRGTRVQVRAPF